MRATLPGLAALAAGGLLLTRQLRREHAAPPPQYPAPPHHLPVGTALAAAAALAAGGFLLSRRLRRDATAQASVTEWIEIDVPVSTAYNQWTQFEEFPHFMASVDSVRQIDDTHLRWRATVAGKTKEWDAEITEQIPDERIAWRSVSGVQNSGVVTFHKISDDRTRVMLQMDYKPETAVEKVGDAAGGVKLATKGNLRKFKQLVEARGRETGAWRGTVTHH